MEDGLAVRPRLPLRALLGDRLPGPARRRAGPVGRAGLHVHSLWSDGAQTPEEIVRAAAGRLDVLALTDHDEIRGARLARDFAHAHPELAVDVVVGEAVSALTCFHGRDGEALRVGRLAGRPRAQLRWSRTAARMPRHVRIQWRSFLRFTLSVRRQVSWVK